MGIIKTQEELIRKMDFYKKIYTKEVIEYYKSLINLEISSLNKDYIPEDILECLRHTEFYDDVARFNIYENALTTLEGDSRLKKLYTGKEKLDVIIPTHIKDYKVYSYNPYKDEVMLFDLVIDEEYRKNKIKDIENNKISYLDIQITNVDKDMILDLAKKLQQNDLKDEGTLREIIQTLSKATGRNVSKEQEEKIINKVVNDGVPKNIDKMF